MRSKPQSVAFVDVAPDSSQRHTLAVVDVTDRRAADLNRQIVSQAAELAAERGTMLSVLVLAANHAPLRDRVDALCRWYCAGSSTVDARWMPRLGSVESVLAEATERYGADVVVLDAAYEAVARNGLITEYARAS